MRYGVRIVMKATGKKTPVVIKFGPFAGFKGIVASAPRKRVTVRIILEPGRSILVELDTDMIERDPPSPVASRVSPASS